MTFLKQLHTNAAPEDVIGNFNDRYQNDTKYRNEVVEVVMTTIEGLNDSYKAKLLGNIFAAHAIGKLDWGIARILFEIIKNTRSDIFNILKHLGESPNYSVRTYAGIEYIGAIRHAGLATAHNHDTSLNSLGILIYHYGLKKDYERSSSELMSQAAYFIHSKQFLNQPPPGL